MIIQFLRFTASKWNIDPKRIAAFGGSAGAGISLWVGFHDDLADPTSDDPVQRQSSRIQAIGSLGGAAERGLGGCMIASIDQPGLRAALNLPEHLESLMVVALGKPSETVVLEDGEPLVSGGIGERCPPDHNDRDFSRQRRDLHHQFPLVDLRS